MDKAEVLEFWTTQRAKVREIVKDAERAHRQWGDMIPGDQNKYIPPLRTVALLRLLRNFGLGGDRWIRQFVLGFPIVWGNRTDRGIPS